MKGNNTLYFNQATMIEALSEYLAKRYNQPLRVTAVTEITNGDYSTKDSFKICVVEAEQAAGQ